MGEQLNPPVLSRRVFFWNQLLNAKPFRVVLGSIALLTAILSGVQAWRAELAVEEQARHRLLSAVPDWPWPVYLCIGLGCLVILLFETSF